MIKSIWEQKTTGPQEESKEKQLESSLGTRWNLQMKEGGSEESSAFEEKKEDQPQKVAIKAIAHREELPQEEAKQVFGKYAELKTKTQKEIEELEKQHEQVKGTKYTYNEKEYNPENIEEYLKVKKESKEKKAKEKEEALKKKQESKE